MFLLAIYETSVGLSLFIYRWKALPEQNINMLKYFNTTSLSSNPKRYALLSQGTGCLQNFTADNTEVEKFKTEKIFKLSNS